MLALEKALLHYCQCLGLGDKFDTVVLYRLVSLWFTHYVTTPGMSLSALISHVHVHNLVLCYVVSDNSITFAKKLLSVPSRHFLPLVYQIASRLNRPNEKGLTESETLFRRTIYDVCYAFTPCIHHVALVFDS